MRHRAWCTLLPFFLFLGGYLSPGSGSPSFAQECCSDNLPNHYDTKSFGPEPVLERELLLLTNQHRIQNGLPALALDGALTQIARDHAQGMAQQGFISHSQPAGNLRFRMIRAGYRHEVARENVARAPSVPLAQNALVTSPGHESNILADDVTRMGIGIMRCPDPLSSQLFIAEIFASPREEYQPAAVQEMLVNRIDELREQGAGSMLPDPSLEEIAARSLNTINLPYKKEELQDVLSASSNELPDEERMEFSKLQANVQMLHNPKNLNIPNHGPEGRARSYGAAVRQITDDQNQVAYLVLTLIGIAR
jgi:uncharacterized protein YkwD